MHVHEPIIFSSGWENFKLGLQLEQEAIRAAMIVDRIFPGTMSKRSNDFILLRVDHEQRGAVISKERIFQTIERKSVVISRVQPM